MPVAPTDIRSLARSHTESAIRTLAYLMANSQNDTVRLGASNSLLDRGWGKPPQSHTGEDGEGAIAITIRHIVEQAGVRQELEPPKIVEHSPLPNGRGEK